MDCILPLQNRVLPTGEIVATPARGTFTGNRGIIHRDDKTLGTSRWSHHAWICCTLDWQGRKRPVMTGRNWTELFFLDEAVAMAAGHRPCGYCRRADYVRFVDAWTEATGQRLKAPQMDKALHRARVHSKSRQQVTHRADIASLPNGAFITYGGRPHLIGQDRLLPYRPVGYDAALPRPTSGPVTVLTPAPMIAVLQSGYTPIVHPTVTIDLSAPKP